MSFRAGSAPAAEAVVIFLPELRLIAKRILRSPPPQSPLGGCVSGRQQKALFGIIRGGFAVLGRPAWREDGQQGLQHTADRVQYARSSGRSAATGFVTVTVERGWGGRFMESGPVFMHSAHSCQSTARRSCTKKPARGITPDRFCWLRPRYQAASCACSGSLSHLSSTFGLHEN